MKRATLSAVEVITIALLATTVVRCQPARYVVHPSSNASEALSGSGVVVKNYETKVSYQGFSQPELDVTWVIDNSGSMSEEAAHVRTNFQNFIDTVQLEADLKIALISRRGNAGTNVTLPVNGPNALQIDFPVWSTDGLEIAAAALCPAGAANGTYCDQILDAVYNANTRNIAGELASFVRATAKKAFIFVTDDESRISADLFRSAFNEVFPGQAPIVYGFVGLDDAQSPCMDDAGEIYKGLSSATGGNVFNICETDWTLPFQSLASHVVQLVAKTIVVPLDLTGKPQIVSVHLNDQPLGESQYLLAADGLHIDPALTKNLAEATIRVQYTVKP